MKHDGNSSDASATLADAIWWFKGFGAATTSDHEYDAYGLMAGLREVRIWLGRVVAGNVRKLGDDETGSVVLTYAEFERFVDAIRDPDCLASRGHARETAERILAQYQTETIAERQPAGTPF